LSQETIPAVKVGGLYWCRVMMEVAEWPRRI